MRALFSLMMVLSLLLLPLSAHAEASKSAKGSTPAASSKASKRKTASRGAKGAIDVEKLRREVSERIAHERKQAEQATRGSAVRKAFESAAAQVKTRLTGAVSDGVVTGDELKKVRESYKLMSVKQASKKAPASKGKKQKIDDAP